MTFSERWICMIVCLDSLTKWKHWNENSWNSSRRECEHQLCQMLRKFYNEHYARHLRIRDYHSYKITNQVLSNVKTTTKSFINCYPRGFTFCWIYKKKAKEIRGDWVPEIIEANSDSWCVVIHCYYLPTRYLLAAGSKQSFQIVVGTFALQK